MDKTVVIAEIEARWRTGRPLAAPNWIASAERDIHRKIGPAKLGPKPREKATQRNLA